MDNLFSWLYSLLYQNDFFALISSFGWGVLSVLLSPCHLATIPLLIAYISSQTKKTSAIDLSLLFSLGILVTLLIIGIITSYLGRLLGDTGGWVNLVTGILLVFAGLFFLDLISYGGIKLKKDTFKFKSRFLALAFGLSAGLALGPCTFAFMAPVFAYGLQISKSKPYLSFSLFIFYGLGHCIVILIAGILSSKINKYLIWAGSSNGILIFKKTSGILVILGGIYILYNGLF